MNPPEEKDPIDTQLREQTPYIDDNGFTQRVIAALPPRRRTWLRPVLLLGSAAVGIVLAIQWLPWSDLPPLDMSALLSLNSQILSPWVVMLSVMTSLFWAVVSAVQWDD
jgi:anti-sigma factor RsiW